MKKNILILILLIITGTIFAEDIQVSGWFFSGEVLTTDEGYTVNNAELRFPGMYGGKSIFFESMKLDKSRKLTEAAFSDDEVEIMSHMGYKLLINESSFAAKGSGAALYINGTIIIYEGEETVMSIPCDDYSFFLDSDYMLHFPAVKNVEGTYKGYHFTAESASTGNMFPDKRNTGFVLKNARIEIPDIEGSIIIPLLSFYPAGGIGYAKTGESVELKTAGYIIETYTTELDEEGLHISGNLKLKGLFENAHSRFDELIIKPDGSFKDADLSVSIGSEIGDSKISSRYMKMKDGELVTHDFKIVFPDSSNLERLYCSRVEISKDGSIVANGDRFKLKDLSVGIDKIGLEEGVIVLSGRYASCSSAEKKAEIESRFPGVKPGVAVRIHNSGLIESIDMYADDFKSYRYYETAEDDPARLLLGLINRDESALNDWVVNGYPLDVMIADKPLIINRIEDKDVISVKWLLEHGADPYAEYKNSNSMNYAVSKNNNEIIDLLLEYNFPLAKFSEYKRNPLKQTISNDRELTIKLLEHGAVLDEPEDVDVTFFDWARVWGDIEYLKKLESFGMKFNIGSNADNPYFSIRKDMEPEQKKELAEYIKSMGISPNGHYGNEKSTLEAYTGYGWAEESKLLASLLDYGNPLTKKGGSLLCLAVEKNLTETALILIEKGASLTGISDSGNSVFDIASAKENQVVLDKMLEYGFRFPVEESGRFFRELNKDFINYFESVSISGISSAGGSEIFTILEKFNEKIQLIKQPVGSIINAETGKYSYFDVDDIITYDVEADIISIEGNRILVSSCIKKDTLSGYDLSMKVFDSKGDFHIESVFGTNDQEIFLDAAVSSENGRGTGKVLFNTVAEDGSSRLHIVTINRFGIVIERKSLMGAEKIIDGEIVNTGDGYLCACLCAGNEMKIRLIKLDKQLNAVQSLSIPVDGYNKIEAEADSGGQATILLTGAGRLNPCEIFIDGDLHILKSYSYVLPLSSRCRLLKQGGKVMLIASVPKTSNRDFRAFKQAAGICIIAADDDNNPLYQKYYSLTLPPEDFSVSTTAGDGIIIMTTALKDNYNSHDTVCIEGIRLNEYAGGVEGQVVDIKTESVDFSSY